MGITFLQNSPNPQEGIRYVFDSNVWLPILGLENKESLSEHYKLYFSKVFKLSDSRILLCPIQISELVNRLLRYHGYKQFVKADKKGDFNDYYKRVYRESSGYKSQHQSILDDIESYRSHIVLCDVKVGNLDEVLDYNPSKLDFNDHYLYLLAKTHGATIITDDRDFSSLDVPVGTFNKRLYQHYKDTIVPKAR